MPSQQLGYWSNSTYPSAIWPELKHWGSDTFTKVKTVQFSCTMNLTTYPCLLIVYEDLHYLEAVHLEAERSMRAAVDEVAALPNYAQDGEVSKPCSYSSGNLLWQLSTLSLTHSGLSQMLDMTRELMPTTQQCPAWLARTLLKLTYHNFTSLEFLICFFGL